MDILPKPSAMYPPSSAFLENPRQQQRRRYNHSDEEWEDRRPIIQELYAEYSLKETMAILKKDHNFEAGERKFRAKVKEWGLGKNLSLSAMKILAAKATKRKREEGKDTEICFGDRVLNPKKLETFQKRKFVKEDVPESPSAATPGNITYHTPISGNPETPGSLTYESLHSRIPGTPSQSISLDSDNTSVASSDPSPRETQHESSTAFLAREEPILPERLSPQLRTSSSPELGDIKGMANLAWTTGDKSQFEESEEMYRQILILVKRALGKEHPNTLAIMHNLGWTLAKQSKYIEAEELFRQTLILRERVSGKEHPNTLTTMHNLARILSKQSRHREAEELFRQTLILNERVSGKEHPETLDIVYNLANTLSKQSKYREAEGLFRQTLILDERVLGKEHPDTLRTKHKLALLSNQQGQSSKDTAADYSPLRDSPEESGPTNNLISPHPLQQPSSLNPHAQTPWKPGQHNSQSMFEGSTPDMRALFEYIGLM